MRLKTIKKRVFGAIDDASSSSVVPTLVAGLTVAIAVVKLLSAVNEFKTIRSSSRKIGFGLNNSKDV